MFIIFFYCLFVRKTAINELKKTLGLSEGNILDIQTYINRTKATAPTILDDLDEDKAKKLKALIRRSAGGNKKKTICFFLSSS